MSRKNVTTHLETFAEQVDTVGELFKKKPSRLANIVALVVAIGLPLAAGAIGGLVTQEAIPTWYAKLRKPAWNPPTWIFGPVWTILYLMMGTASWLIWRKGATTHGILPHHSKAKQASRQALLLYGVHLVLNTAWSLIFFGLRRVDLALVEIVALWSMLVATLVSFYRIRPLAGLLLVPYQLWTTFATALTGAIWWLNR